MNSPITQAQNQNKKIVISITGLFLILLGVPIKPLMYVGILFCFICVFCAKTKEEASCYIFCWLSVSTIFKLQANSTSLFTYLEIVFLGMYFFKSKCIKRNFFFAWMFFAAYLTVGSNLEFNVLLKSIMVPLLFYVVLLNITREELKEIFKHYSIGVFFASLVGILKDRIPQLVTFVQFKTERTWLGAGAFSDTVRFSGLWADPNYYSIHLILILAVSTYLYSKHEINDVKFFSIYSAVMFFGAITGSKSFLGMFALTTVFLIILLLKERKYGRVVCLLIAMTVALYMFFLGYIDIFSTILARLQASKNSSNGLTTGRTEIWSMYMTYFLEHPVLVLFGNGIGNGYPLSRVAHNIYIDFIAIYGVIGTILFLITMYTAGASLRVRREKGTCIPIVVLMIMYSFLSMIFMIDFVFELVIAYGFWKLDFTKPVTKN